MTVEAAKRPKVDNRSGTKTNVYASRIFSPFRVVGNVSNGTPFAVGTLGSTFYIVTSVGKTFQIYDANNLHLLFVSERETESNIVALAAHFHYVYAAYGNKVGIYKRGIQEYVVELDAVAETITSLCIFGDFLCASTDNNTVYIYKKASPKDRYATEFYTKFDITQLQGGDIVSLVHLPTYLNKLTVVTKNNILLYNIRSGKLLFTSDEFPDQITACEVAPVLDILALGTANGEIILYNVRKSKILRSIKLPQLRITSISFRTDGSPHMCVSGTNGDVIFYDLDRRSRIHVLKGIHREIYGGVTKAAFLNGQPIIVTTGGDNSLKEYVFDPSLSQSDQDGVIQPPRFLRSRCGHSLPPTTIEFADQQSHFLLSSSRDRSLWAFSLRKDAQSQELSQRQHKQKGDGPLPGGSIKEKFSEITAIALETNRVGDWENVVTAHRDETFARTWDMRTKRVGRWTFATGDGGYVKSVAISPCGNFGFVGSSLGDISVYNMQSGILRKRYKFHKNAAVTGIAVDSMNRKMVSCGLDGLIGFYDFNKSTLLGKLQLDAPITAMVYHRASDLFAVALDDFSIIVIDAVTQRIVRQLWGHSNRITSFDFSPDGRWIISASLDSTLRTWDLPTGGCIDGVKLDSVITCLKFSPNGDMLATAHVTYNGICIWTNRAQFKAVSNRIIDEAEFNRLILPNSSATGNGIMLSGAFDSESGEADAGTSGSADEDFRLYQSADQIGKDLITLSLEPRSKMNTLLHMDVVKQRSKPIEAPKKPEKVPFFLQLKGETVGDEASGREGISFETPGEIQARESEIAKDLEAQNEVTRLKPKGLNMEFESTFTRLLREGHESGGHYGEFLKMLIGLSPSATDLEIRSLHAFEPFDEIIWFIEAITEGLETNRDFELYETYMSVLFRIHGDVVNNYSIKNERLAESLAKWESVHGNFSRLDELVGFCSGVLNFVSGM